MSGIDWPEGFTRTQASERERNRSFQATLGSTTSDLATEMDRMGVNEWRASIGNQHTKSNGLPLHNANPSDPGFVLRWSDDGEQFAVACDRYSRLRDNVRAVYLWVHETRMRSQRPVVTGDSEFAAARLPPADDGNVVVASEPPHEILGITPDADAEEIKSAWREKAMVTHPDQGGSRAEWDRLMDAREAMMK